MKKLRIVPYKLGSESAKKLAEALSERLGYKVWRGQPKEKSVNLHWGKAQNKLDNFALFDLHGVSHVPYTTSKEVAQAWLNAGATVFARTASGQAGSGITVVSPPDGNLPDRPLYTQYVKKRKEFRVHVFDEKVIDVQQKRRKNGEEANHLIRSHLNGWVFCHENIEEPEGLRELASKAVSAVGLPFGGVDIIWNSKMNKCFVLEVNSAPGITGSTVEKYANEIQSRLQ